MRAIFGIDKIHSGVIKLLDKPIKIRSPKKAIKNGLVMLPEDRNDQGVLPNISVKGNISVSMLREICSFGIVNQGEEDKIAVRNIAKFDIRTPDSEKLLLQLSGGNQQKTILARCLECNPKVLILDEPTKGIDVGAKAEFHRIIFDCAKAGMAVIVVSSELPELISLSDRIIVIRDGSISGELERKDFSEEKILKFAMPQEE
jgi:ABC-type sugar transport system ATPase subunit